MSSFEFVRLVWVDYAGIRRCRVVPRKRFEEIKEFGIGFASACLFLPCWGDCPPSTDPAGQATGECRLIADVSTLKQLPWQPQACESMALIHMHSETTGDPWDCCPRTVLAHALQLLEEEVGVVLMAAFEFEFTLLHKKSTTNGSSSFPAPIDTDVYCQTSAFDAASPVLQEICSSLEQLGQTVEQVHPESAPGQFEIVTAHCRALQAADDCVFCKEAICGVARKHGLTASFFPKLFKDQAGTGMHCHLSFVDAVTADPVMADCNRPHTLSLLGEAFIAGVLHHLPALMPFTAATPASYARIQPSTWSGAYQCWGVSNRETPVRLLNSLMNRRPESVNFEVKTIDATANPFLALAALISAGLSGIRQGLSLPEPVFGDPATISSSEREALGIVRLPESMEAALAALEKDPEFQTVLQEATGSETLCRMYPLVKKSECEKMNVLSLEEQAAMLYARF